VVNKQTFGGEKMSNRKSQLEKFESKMAKKKRDEDAIKQSNVKGNTLEKRAGKIVKDFDLSTEDIFAIITRDSMGAFAKMWNNSMESVIRETIRTEIRQVIREELAAAYRGVIKGMTEDNISDISETIREEVDNFKEEIQYAAYTAAEPKQETEQEEKTIKYTVKERDEKELKQLVIEAHYKNDVDPYSGKSFKSSGPRNNTLYQNFMKQNRGTKGVWKQFVLDVITSI
jgi:gas vesicle protein